MSLAESNRRFLVEVASMLGRKVMVTTATGHYKGILAGMDNNLNIVLTDAINDRGERVSKVLLSTGNWREVIMTEQYLDLADFAKELEKYFPGMIKYVEEANLIQVGESVRVTQNGVEGSGLTAKRVKELFDNYLKRRQ
ncbi:Lsm family RNA-binding protein [Thermocladium modestius]|uniref:Lsm family RNA-binding protein n=1 Tax=Thermocladium modestius TaxID=62609 RepID=UPI0016639A66|nr:Lsm family RNA-binding protein [Thermocladium modestius]